MYVLVAALQNSKHLSEVREIEGGSREREREREREGEREREKEREREREGGGGRRELLNPCLCKLSM